MLRTAEQKCLSVYRASLPREDDDDGVEEEVNDENEGNEDEKDGPSAALLTNGTNSTAPKMKNREEPAVVIAADTVIVLSTPPSLLSSASSTTNPSSMTQPQTNFRILEKPRSEAQHISMLQALRTAGSHKVYTAVVCASPLASARDPGYAMESHVEETTVYFSRAVTDETVLAYVRTREGADKAGGYAIQGVGGLLMVERIEGAWDNVVGLPVRNTLAIMEKVMNLAEDDDADAGGVEGYLRAEEEEEEGLEG